MLQCLSFILITTTLLSSLPSIESLAVNRSVAERSPKISASDCQFYGYVEKNVNVWNVYTIQLAGWGNDGTPGGCAPKILSQIGSQCRATVQDWACDEVEENAHDTEISFRILKPIISQPDCVMEAVRIASEAENRLDNVDCICLAYCWPSELQFARGPGGHNPG